MRNNCVDWGEGHEHAKTCKTHISCNFPEILPAGPRIA
jgi:hypothetical protein